jgi:hypothetical protein
LLVGADAPDDETDTREDCRDAQGPEALFGLADAVVAAGEPERDAVGDGASP